MYKLLIVDDEPFERQALRFFVEHSSLEIDTILEAGNGIDAVQLSLMEQPNLCILDIKMPGLNGLEAMEQIKSVNKGCKVIFSSAYSYFDYAIRALQLGALDFLVKPVKKETLIRVLNKGIDELDAQQCAAEHQMQMTDMTYVLEKRILRELITGQIDEETLWFLECHSIGSSACCCFFCRLGRILNEKEKEHVSRHLRKDLASTGYKYQLHVHKQRIDFLLYCTQTRPQDKMQQVVFDIFDRTLKEYDIPYTSGAGSWVDDVFQLEQSYIDAQNKVDGHPSLPVRDLLTEQSRFDTEKNSNAVSNQVPPEIKLICEYLQENYEEKLTLEEITQHVGFSKYYGGRLFKQYMGMTIIEYLIKIRLDRAKELLTQGEYSIKQISYMVGYQDPNYFTWSFKKATGISPVKYRYFQNLP